MGTRYALNYLWGVLFHRPLTKTHINVRAPIEGTQKSTVRGVRYAMLAFHVLVSGIVVGAAVSVTYAYTQPHEASNFSFSRIRREMLAGKYSVRHYFHDDDEASEFHFFRP